MTARLIVDDEVDMRMLVRVVIEMPGLTGLEVAQCVCKDDLDQLPSVIHALVAA